MPHTLRTIGEIAGPIWTAVGPLLGVLVGALLARGFQRRQWIADNNVLEYRELLTAITQGSMVYMEVYSFAKTPAEHEVRLLAGAQSKAMQVARDRIFIAHVVDELNIVARWMEATRHFTASGDEDTQRFGNAVGSLINDIHGRAIKDIRGAKIFGPVRKSKSRK